MSFRVSDDEHGVWGISTIGDVSIMLQVASKAAMRKALRLRKGIMI